MKIRDLADCDMSCVRAGITQALEDLVFAMDTLWLTNCEDDISLTHNLDIAYKALRIDAEIALAKNSVRRRS